MNRTDSQFFLFHSGDTSHTELGHKSFILTVFSKNIQKNTSRFTRYRYKCFLAITQFTLAVLPFKLFFHKPSGFFPVVCPFKNRHTNPLHVIGKKRYCLTQIFFLQICPGKSFAYLYRCFHTHTRPFFYKRIP